MMSRQVFLPTSHSQPSARWKEAFPHGACAGRDELADVPASAVLWMGSADADWQARLKAVLEANASARVIVLAEMPDDDEALRALEAGARGYCHARAVPSLLREAALAVEHGGLWVGATLLARFLGALRQHIPASARSEVHELLSARELEVASAVAAGRSNKEVAVALGITDRTVKAHLGAAFEKLGVRDRLQLAVRMGAAASVAGEAL